LTSGFENLSMYGFTVDYPDDSRVQFNSKSRRESGDVVFQLPQRLGIFLSWGELEKVSKRFGSAGEHAKYSLEAMKKGKNVKNFEQVSTDTVSLHGHKGSINKVKFDEKALKLIPGAKDMPREAYSLHVHCDKSDRYFVLYTMVPANDEAGFDRIMQKMRESFSCH